MIGDERKRFCTQCSLSVFNLSDITREEAEQFLFESEGRICARFYRRADGTVITKDCPVGVRAFRERMRTAAVAFTSLIATFITGVFAVKTTESIIDTVPIGNVPAPPYLERTVTVFADDVPVVGQIDSPELLMGEVDYTVGQGFKAFPRTDSVKLRRRANR